jgi:ribosomal protein S18 acetylase RimI-like enzyme
MKLPLRKQRIENLWKSRNISETDVRALAELMLEAYKGTVDYEGETLEDAISEVQGTINGKYGPFLQKCSFIIEENMKAISASMVTWSDTMDMPLLAFSMTLPIYRNRGMATFLLKKSMNALIGEGYSQIYLVVTETNIPAKHLYEKIGFTPIQYAEEDYWLA